MSPTVNSIQFLRSIAALLVVLFHTDELVTKTFDPHPPAFFSHLLGIGPSGVHIFFVISGFIMFYTSHDKFGNYGNAKNFLLRRFIRVFPIYWICMILYYSLHSFYLTKYNLSIPDLVASAFLIPGYASLVIGPGWTLPYELFFYFVFASAMILSPKTGLQIITLAFLTLVALGFVMKAGQPITHFLTNSVLLEFLFGAWIAFFVVHGDAVDRRIVNWLLILAICGFGGGIIVGYERLPSVVMWGIPSALLIAGMALQEKNGSTPTLISRLSHFGDSSYSLYLLHILILDISIRLIHEIFPGYNRNTIATVLILSIVCFFTSIFFYWTIEKNTLSILKRRLRRRQVSAVSQAPII